MSSHSYLRYRNGNGHVYVWCECGDNRRCYRKTGKDGGAMDTKDSAALQRTDKAGVA